MTPGGASYIKNVLYKLKLDYGTPIDIYRYGSQTVDTRTGKIEKPKTVIKLSLAVVLDNGSKREFVPSKNADFNYGGYFDTDKHVCIIDAEDVPFNFVPTMEDYIVHNNTRWAISSITELISAYGWVIMMKDTQGVPPAQLLSDSVCTDLDIDQGAHND
jgi:thioester reductase-like protein